MSWIVEKLIIDSEKIKNSGDNLESDLFLDLIALETKLESLYLKGHISILEIKILDYVSRGYNITDTAKELKIARATASMMFKNVCTRISFYLGGYFTDEGYLDYLKEKYNLGQEEISKARKFLDSRYRHNFVRKK